VSRPLWPSTSPSSQPRYLRVRLASLHLDMLQVCLSGCYICFTHTLQVFYLDIAIYFSMAFQVFSGIFVSVLDAYFKCLKCIFKCFICLRTYVSSECFKNRSSAAVRDPPTATGVRAGEVGQDTERRSDSTDPTECSACIRWFGSTVENVMSPNII
jgi:hypothetical protein